MFNLFKSVEHKRRLNEDKTNIHYCNRHFPISFSTQLADNYLVFMSFKNLNLSPIFSLRTLILSHLPFPETFIIQPTAGIFGECASRTSLMALGVTTALLFVIYICTVAYFVAHQKAAKKLSR